MVAQLNLFSIFHLNIAYSSIEEEQRIDVITRCYWPLLRLVREHRLPVGIEATGYTLELINDIDKAWVVELRHLVTEGVCDFIGSGYSQIIGPLVPACVNLKNLQIGNQVYSQLLGIQPKIALVNEQAFSSGLIEHYLSSNYEAIVMEWDNPASTFPDWGKAIRYFPQKVVDQQGRQISVLWSQSIGFQQFQRYVHNEITYDEYISYLSSHQSNTVRYFCIYANDVEIFDFRPGRYHTEPTISAKTNEWQRIARLLISLREQKEFKLVTPSAVLQALPKQQLAPALTVGSASHPIHVKKQRKYNLTRWAVTGIDDLQINSECWEIYNVIKDLQVGDPYWKKLCYFWSSDFRTHLTQKRWEQLAWAFRTFKQQINAKLRSEKGIVESNAVVQPFLTPTVRTYGRFIEIETNDLRLKVNKRRGLSIEALCFSKESDQPLIRTLQQGYFNDISMGWDWYSGHLVLENLGHAKVTDLELVDPSIEFDKYNNQMKLKCDISTPFGTIHKTITLFCGEPKIRLHYLLDWHEAPLGSLRLGFVTINPDVFDNKALYYQTHNGGYAAEKYQLAGQNFDHGGPVSFLVSANGGIGATESQIIIGDANNGVVVSFHDSNCAPLSMLKYQEVDESFFCRLYFSLSELDETRRHNNTGLWQREFTLLLSPHG